ncbi:hypothetical protein AB0K16_22495 [Nonomuraea jabiensis]|uniref:hypothetical protein n=1 Tax=Nonomuraea jabiensis TaxID=882448 RepID=UPI0034125C58
MSAVYPAQFLNWTQKFDYTTIVFADHFNTVQDELNALLATVGLTPQIARNDPGSTPFTLLPVVNWIANASDDDLEHVLGILGNIGDKSHRDILSEISQFWPDWE